MSDLPREPCLAASIVALSLEMIAKAGDTQIATCWLEFGVFGFLHTHSQDYLQNKNGLIKLLTFHPKTVWTENFSISHSYFISYASVCN